VITPRAVTVHGLPDMLAALELGLPVTLLSAPGAALYAGCSWWLALVAHGRAAFPDIPFTDILDCADAPGRAMAALRAGQRRIVLDPACSTYAAVAAAAEGIGAMVLPERPPSLDLAQRHARRNLRDWLANVTGAPG
jgi:hypothetical protein